MKQTALSRRIDIPIVMYHSVSDDQRWLWGHLSCPVSAFEDHVRTLARNGFVAVSLQDVYDHRLHDSPLPKKPVVLTFDDGYLDNWVYAFPILKRYDFKGTIFVNPDFVDPTDKLRPNLDDVATGQVTEALLQSTGYLSWAEMSAMEADGVVDIQAHAMTHTWHFRDGRIVDFHHPGDPYPWLAWNAWPERKYLWLHEDQSRCVPYGTPVYAHDKALVTRRYFPDPDLADFVVKQVAERGDEAFFERERWRDTLEQLCAQYRSQHPLNDRQETEQQYQDRVRHELGTAKELIEANLRKQANFLCWPGGGYNDTTERIAKEVGYLATTLSPRDARWSSQHPGYISRLGAPAAPCGTETRYRSGRYLVYMLHCAQGMRRYCLARKTSSLLFLLQSRFHSLGKQLGCTTDPDR